MIPASIPASTSTCGVSSSSASSSRARSRSIRGVCRSRAKMRCCIPTRSSSSTASRPHTYCTTVSTRGRPPDGSGAHATCGVSNSVLTGGINLSGSRARRYASSSSVSPLAVVISPGSNSPASTSISVTQISPLRATPVTGSPGLVICTST